MRPFPTGHRQRAPLARDIMSLRRRESACRPRERQLQQSLAGKGRRSVMRRPQSIFRLKRFALQTIRPVISRKNAVFPPCWAMQHCAATSRFAFSMAKRSHRPPEATHFYIMTAPAGGAACAWRKVRFSSACARPLRICRSGRRIRDREVHACRPCKVEFSEKSSVATGGILRPEPRCSRRNCGPAPPIRRQSPVPRHGTSIPRCGDKAHRK